MMTPNTSHCGILIKKIHTTLEKNANNSLRKEDLTSAQVAVLMELSQADKRTLSMKELERRLKLAQSTIAGTVARLAHKGLVVYRDVEEDKRVKWVELTDAGMECCKKAAVCMDEAEAQLLGCLSDVEREIFCKLLEKVSNSLN